ncbi:17236_t:CDS:2, partial [Racocetra fulgida]
GKGGQGAKCGSDNDCACPFICRFGGEDTYKCQITDTRGYDEACGFCNFTLEVVPITSGMKNSACKEGLKCAPGNDLSFICVDTRDIGAECDSDDRCLSGICRMYGEDANTCQKNDTRKLGESCYNDFACAARDGNENIFCGIDKNSKGLCCDDHE